MIGNNSAYLFPCLHVRQCLVMFHGLGHVKKPDDVRVLKQFKENHFSVAVTFRWLLKNFVSITRTCHWRHYTGRFFSTCHSHSTRRSTSDIGSVL